MPRRAALRDELSAAVAPGTPAAKPHDPFRVASLTLTPDVDPVAGAVSWDPARSLWNGGMLAASVVLVPLYFSWGAVGVFALLLAVTMCTGHSVGFHRRHTRRHGDATELATRIDVRVSTHFNWYANPVARLLIGNLAESNLGYYKRRSEGPRG